MLKIRRNQMLKSVWFFFMPANRLFNKGIRKNSTVSILKTGYFCTYNINSSILYILNTIFFKSLLYSLYRRLFYTKLFQSSAAFRTELSQRAYLSSTFRTQNKGSVLAQLFLKYFKELVNLFILTLPAINL